MGRATGSSMAWAMLHCGISIRLMIAVGHNENPRFSAFVSFPQLRTWGRIAAIKYDYSSPLTGPPQLKIIFSNFCSVTQARISHLHRGEGDHFFVLGYQEYHCGPTRQLASYGLRRLIVEWLTLRSTNISKRFPIGSTGQGLSALELRQFRFPSKANSTIHRTLTAISSSGQYH
jgi:hypothetical protein